MILNLFTFFHLNLGFSSIEEKDRPQVIKNCYWPLLNLIKKFNVPIAIEASGCTIETIKKIDPKWINEFKKLLMQKKCELIGSGYAQIIGPLVPAKVNLINLKLGNECYRKNLNHVPITALLNEQAYSTGIVSHYVNSGYKNIIMEWNNSALSNTDKRNKEVKYKFQKISNIKKKKVNLIWNNSIIFQKFQRYAHGEINLDYFYKYLKTHISKKESRTLSLYGNDAEVFDFRPGRFNTEEKLNKTSEWKRIEELLRKLKKDKEIQFIKLSEIPKYKKLRNLKNNIQITSAKYPIVVKKQEKYNIIRWAVSGRNDTLINTICWSLYKSITKEKKINFKKFKELCYLWSSDFRTHITFKRWLKYLKRLKNFCKLQKINHPYLHSVKLLKTEKNTKAQHLIKKDIKANKFKITENSNFLEVIGKNIAISLNKRKGLAVEYFKDFNHGNSKLFGTIVHGYFEDIRYSADFFSGNMVFEPSGKHKITDLLVIKPKIKYFEDKLIIETIINTEVGKIFKKWTFDDKNRELTLHFKLKTKKISYGSFRFGHLNLDPVSFNQQSLFFKTHNGGSEFETFKINKNFNHYDPVSNLISANQAIGATNGTVIIGDKKKKLQIKFDNSKTAVIGLLSHKKIYNKHLTRLIFSAKEVDDTSKYNLNDFIDICFTYSLIR